MSTSERLSGNFDSESHCAPPERVERTRAFFERNGAWVLLSRNSAATSCRDAAARRTRLGDVGIPLHDELKSLCVVLYRPEGRSFALLHCRAGESFNLDAAAHVLHATRPLARMAADELNERFGTIYGTVNPFAEGERFVQVFDIGVLARYTAPHTMMTNAGEPTWAVEFRPQEVIDALNSVTEVHVAPITTGIAGGTKLPTFGLLTGNGPESGQALWQLLNGAVRDGLIAEGRPVGDLAYPRVIIHSEPEMGLSMELADRSDDVWEVVTRAMEQLCDAGASVLAIACNTTQWYADRIREQCAPRQAEFVSMAEITIDYIQTNKLSDLTVIGIPTVADLGDLSAYRSLSAFGVRPVKEHARPYLQELGYEVKRLALGEQSSKALNLLRNALQKGVETENVLIALTEISVLLHRFPRFAEHLSGKRLIDPLKLYAKALAERYIRALPRADTKEDSWG